MTDPNKRPLYVHTAPWFQIHTIAWCQILQRYNHTKLYVGWFTVASKRLCSLVKSLYLVACHLVLGICSSSTRLFFLQKMEIEGHCDYTVGRLCTMVVLLFVKQWTTWYGRYLEGWLSESDVGFKQIVKLKQGSKKVLKKGMKEETKIESQGWNVLSSVTKEIDLFQIFLSIISPPTNSVICNNLFALIWIFILKLNINLYCSISSTRLYSCPFKNFVNTKKDCNKSFEIID